jgi:predicted nucleic acid-binding protein
MYLVGAPHPNKERAISALSRLRGNFSEFVTDVEVYQEILHRYSSIGRFDFIDVAFSSLDDIVRDILSFGIAEIHVARDLIRSVRGLSARDALHVAVMQSAGISQVLSYDWIRRCPRHRTTRINHSKHCEAIIHENRKVPK